MGPGRCSGPSGGTETESSVCFFQTFITKDTKQRKKVRLNADVWPNNTTHLSEVGLSTVNAFFFILQVKSARRTGRRQTYVALHPHRFTVF